MEIMLMRLLFMLRMLISIGDDPDHSGVWLLPLDLEESNVKI